MIDPHLHFGDYEVLSLPDGSPALLGEGTSGETYKAVHREEVFGRPLETFAAVKVIKAGRLEDEAARGQFHRELKVLMQVIHPNVVRYLRHGSTKEAGAGDSTWYAMEFCGGGNLQEYAKGRGGVPEAEVVALAVQAAAGLGSVHEVGFVHCDVKPANLLLDFRAGRRVPTVKLSDFGSVQEIREKEGGETAEGLLSGEEFRGSALYASPEQIKGHRLDGRSDIYSLGITLWHLLLGDRPFLGDLQDVQRWHLGQESHESFLPSRIHPRFLRLLASMVEKDPAKRPASCVDVEAALRGLQEDLAVNPQGDLSSSPAGDGLEDVFEVDYTKRLTCPMGNRFPARRVSDGREVDLLFVHAEQAARAEVQAHVRQSVEKLAGDGVPASVAAPLETRRFGDELVVICAPIGRATVKDLLERRGGTLPFEEAVTLLAPVARAVDFLVSSSEIGGLSLRISDIHLRLDRADGSTLADGEVEWMLAQGRRWTDVVMKVSVDPLRLPPQGGTRSGRTQVTVDSTGTLSGTVKSSGLPSLTDDPRLAFAALIYRIVVGHEAPESTFLTPHAFTPTQRLGEQSNDLLRGILASTSSTKRTCQALLEELCDNEGLRMPAAGNDASGGKQGGAQGTWTGNSTLAGTSDTDRRQTGPFPSAPPIPAGGQVSLDPPTQSGATSRPLPEAPDLRTRKGYERRWVWMAAAAVFLLAALFVPGSPLRRVFATTGNQAAAEAEARAKEARRQQLETLGQQVEAIAARIPGASESEIAELRGRAGGIGSVSSGFPEIAARLGELEGRLEERAKALADERDRRLANERREKELSEKQRKIEETQAALAAEQERLRQSKLDLEKTRLAQEQEEADRKRIAAEKRMEEDRSRQALERQRLEEEARRTAQGQQAGPSVVPGMEPGAAEKDALGAELRTLLTGWIATNGQNDLNAYGALLDDQVDYQYVEGRLASRREVVEDFGKNVKRWPFRRFEVRGGQFNWEPRGDKVAINFTMDYRYQDANGKQASGSTDVGMDVRKANGRWVVSRFNETVNRVRNDKRGM